MPLSSTDVARRDNAIGKNIRRIMARQGLTYEEVVAACQLDERTIRGLVRGTNRPHARTLHKLAFGLGVEVDELFDRSAFTDEAAFDRACNPVIDTVLETHPDVFTGWTDAEFDELSSRFGTGGELNEAGALAAAQTMNDKRRVIDRVAVILETHEAELLTSFVALLYSRVTDQREGDVVTIGSG